MTALSLVSVAFDPNPAPSWIETLVRTIRPEFQADPYIPASNDPILFGAVCVVPSCTSYSHRHGLCAAHIAQWDKDNRPDKESWIASASMHRYDTAVKKCLVAACPRSAIGALCDAHTSDYQYRGGSNLNIEVYADTAKAFFSGPVDVSKECIYPECSYPVKPAPKSSRNPIFCDRHAGAFEQYLKHNPETSPAFWVNYRLTSRLPRYQFDGLVSQVRLELQYVLQCRHDERRVQWRPDLHTNAVKAILSSATHSLLDWRDDQWSDHLKKHKYNRTTEGFILYAWRTLTRLKETVEGITVYDRNVWHFTDLNFGPNDPATQGHLDFSGIEPEWLRLLTKRWARWRLNCGKRPNTLLSNVSRMTSFAKTVSKAGIPFGGPADFNRALLNSYADLVRSSGHSDTHKMGLISCVDLFLSDIHAQGWEPRIPANVRYHREEMPKVRAKAPRYIPEFLMQQMEHDAQIARMGSIDQQTILRVLIDTGLRSEDVMRLRVNAVIRDPSGATYLKFLNHKFNREAVVPISEALAHELTEQIKRSIARYPRTEWAFPRETGNPDGLHCYSYGAWKQQLNRWLETIELRDEFGKPASVSSHRFRHTFGTRLVNKKVPLEIVRRLLDHNSVAMTEHYARIHDSTIRAEWEKVGQRVNILGETVLPIGAGTLNDAAWALENLSRAKQTLPNGYCARPLQQECPHPNACLTCPDFRTTKEFLPLHRDQYVRTLKMVQDARTNGQDRLLKMNEPVLKNLSSIISALEGDTDEVNSTEQPQRSVA